MTKVKEKENPENEEEYSLIALAQDESKSEKKTSLYLIFRLFIYK